MKILLVIFSSLSVVFSSSRSSFAEEGTSYSKQHLYAQMNSETATPALQTDPCQFKKNKIQRWFDSSFVRVIQVKMGCAALTEKDLLNSEKKKLNWFKNWEKIGSADFDSDDFLESANKNISEFKSAIATLVDFAPFYKGTYPVIEELLLKTVRLAYSPLAKTNALKNWVMSYAFCAPIDEVEGFLSEIADYFQKDPENFLQSLNSFLRGGAESIACKPAKKFFQNKTFAVNFLNLLTQNAGATLANDAFRSKVKNLLLEKPEVYSHLKEALDEVLLNPHRIEDEAP